MCEAPSPRRNIGIFAHIDAGKTSLTERLLYVAGRIRSLGSVDEGTTATDYLAVERERGITVKAACARLTWRDTAIALIDTPGHVDFGAEIERSLRALDGAVVLVCGVAGVQSRTETIVRALDRHGTPRLFFVNKMDRRGVSFSRAMSELRVLSDGRAVPLVLPWGEGEAFRGLVNLVAMEAVDFSCGGVPKPVPESLYAAAATAREELLALLAEEDSGIMEDFVAGRPSAPARIAAALRRAVIAGRAAPVLCGSALSDGATVSLLGAVVDYLPAPEEVLCPEACAYPLGLPAPEGAARAGERRAPSPSDPFSSLVFKTQADRTFGRLSWLRVFSGRLAAGDCVLDAGSGRLLRVQKLFSIQAATLEERPEALAGDIVAAALVAAGRKAGRSTADSGGDAAGGTRGSGLTGASLCAPERPILYEPILFEEPVIAFALEPERQADQPALRAALYALLEEDPSLRLREDAETGRIALAGMGELHLEVALARLKEEFGVRVRAGAPEVAYRECPTQAARERVDFERDYNGTILNASVELALEPEARGSGIAFAVVPELKAGFALVAAVRRGVESSLSAGPARGFPVLDAAVRVLGLRVPQARQAELAAEIAASLALRRCLEAAHCVLLEPWMRIELVLPEEFLGAAMALVAARGGRVEAIGDVAGAKAVEASAPLRLLFGLASEIRSATQGRVELQLRFSRYEPVPRDFSAKRP